MQFASTTAHSRAYIQRLYFRKLCITSESKQKNWIFCVDAAMYACVVGDGLRHKTAAKATQKILTTTNYYRRLLLLWKRGAKGRGSSRDVTGTGTTSKVESPPEQR